MWGEVWRISLRDFNVFGLGKLGFYLLRWGICFVEYVEFYCGDMERFIIL